MDDPVANSFIAGGSSGVILGCIYLVYKMLKHSSCRSNCCGQKSSLTIDLEKGAEPSPDEKKPNVTV
jgi:hypothetical protein